MTMIKSKCGEMLKASQEMQNAISKLVTENITLGLPITPENTNVLNFLATINGEIIHFLIENGVTYDMSEDETIVSITLPNGTYKSHKSKVFKDGIDVTKTPVTSPLLTNIEVKQTSIPDNEIIPEEMIKEETTNQDENLELEFDDNTLSNIDMTTENSNIIDPSEDELMFDDFNMLLEPNTDSVSDQTNDSSDEINFDDIPITEEAISNDSETSDSDTNLELEFDNDTENKLDDSTEIVNDVDNEDIQSEYNAPIISSLKSGDIFIEEKRIHKDNLVFDTYKLGLSHMGFGRADEMYFMIAPFELKQTETATVPIIVYCYFNGRTYHASSYDTKEQGKNLVQITVGDYEFLVRGGFNRDGRFQTQIMTTGISANQKDKIAVYSHKEYSPNRNTSKNGHAKFKYIGENGETGIMDVFPIDPEENDFIAVGRCADFVDYYDIGHPKRGGISQNYIYGDVNTQTIVARWDDDYLDADVVPV